jgi:hypothetical protein
VKSWSVLSACALVACGLFVTGKIGDRRLLLPGATTDGHHQIEVACESCHGEPFGGTEALDAACKRCHGGALDAADDSHPLRLFSDPRNADRLARLDARRCVTCHREHWPEGTREGGVTVPDDQCALCHEDVSRDRPSHVGLEPASCASTGCHKYHDNRSMYEEFLVEHAGEARLLGRDDRSLLAASAVRGAKRTALPRAEALARPLSRADRDAPIEHAASDAEISAWADSQHALGGVNCSGCHAPEGPWRDEVGVAVCGRCHAAEKASWVSGRHGMRVGLGLEPMRPELARLPMQASVSAESLDCNSCHTAHRFDRARAAVDACQRCHADPHTLAYAASPHAETWRAELARKAPSGSGVSCATCHMPRREHAAGRVQHDQNDNLRPREKMIRGVCLDCHGLAFSLDALADPALIANNFAGTPRAHVPSIDWALARTRPPRNLETGDDHDPPTAPTPAP